MDDLGVPLQLKERKVLLLTSNPEFFRSIHRELGKLNISTHNVYNTPTAINFIQEQNTDDIAVLLDTHNWRKGWEKPIKDISNYRLPNIPIITITEDSDPRDPIACLARHYKNQAKRRRQLISVTQSPFTFCNATIHPQGSFVQFPNGQTADLRTMELATIQHFVFHKETILCKGNLLYTCCGPYTSYKARNMEMIISRIRTAWRANQYEANCYLKTVNRVGFVYTTEAGEGKLNEPQLRSYTRTKYFLT